MNRLNGKKSFAEVPKEDRAALRSDLYLVSESLNKLNRQGKLTDPEQKVILNDFRSKLRPMTQFIPLWVKVAVAFALGCGTMIGWKRIVVTVGEKIGKSHLTYAQGASAELVAMGTIMAADSFGLTGQHNSRTVFWDCRHDGGEPLGLPGKNTAKYFARLGSHPASLRTARGGNLLRRIVHRL